MRSVHTSIGLMLVSLALASCAGTQAIPPEEVIKRAVIHSHTVDSATLAISASVRTEQSNALSGSVVVQSVVRSGGQAWSADTLFDLESSLQRGFERASGRVVLVAPGDGRIYLRPESMEGLLGDMIKKSMTGSLNGWWVTGSGASMETAHRTTPDPALLSGYADAITVAEDMGFDRSGSGPKQYHYRVALKSEALSSVPGGGVEPTTLTGDGELWIDSADFSLSRALWNIHGIPTTIGPLELKADILFSDYNHAPLLHAPAGSSSVLPLESIFAIFSVRR